VVMGNYDEIIEALTILKKYPHGGWVVAEHDEIFVGEGVADKVSVEDKVRLEELGFVVNDFGGFRKFV
jgi:hypothetical protein